MPASSKVASKPDMSQLADPVSVPPAVQPANEMAVAALILGILGFLWVVPVVGSILGIVFGCIALNQIKQGKGTGAGMAHTGLWLGVASLALTALVIVGIIIALPSLQTSIESATTTARKAETDEIVSHLEAYYAQNGYYPATLTEMPNFSVPAIDEEQYVYQATPKNCVGSVESITSDPSAQLCTGYTLKASLVDGDTYVRRGNEKRTIPIPSVTETQSAPLQVN